LAGQVTEAHRAKARQTWLAVKDRMEPSAFTLELMDEFLGMEMMTNDPASAKERQHRWRASRSVKNRPWTTWPQEWWPAVGKDGF
jgi:hypothetical protein